VPSPPRNQLTERGATALVMAVAAVGSSSPSRSNRRHVQKSRASRTSARIRSAGRLSAAALWQVRGQAGRAGRRRCGAGVRRGRRPRPGHAGPPLRHRRGLPIPAVVAKQGGVEPVSGQVVCQRGGQVGQRVQLYPPRLAGAEQGGVLGEMVVDSEALNPGSSRDLGDGRPRRTHLPMQIHSGLHDPLTRLPLGLGTRSSVGSGWWTGSPVRLSVVPAGRPP
jgi:hypothetical protein